MVFDTHCHLDASSFDGERESVLERAVSAGLTGILVPSITPSRPTLPSHEMLFLARGCHPHEASLWTETPLSPLDCEDCVAIGESGLDFFRCKTAPEIQRQALQSQCKLALEMEKPILLHERESFGALLEETDAFPNLTAVFHAFHHDKVRAQSLFERGHYIGLGGMVTYPANGALREAIVEAPPDRLLLETDSPWLPPQSKRGKRNEPSFIVEVLERVAEIRGTTPRLIEAQTTENAVRLFLP